MCPVAKVIFKDGTILVETDPPGDECSYFVHGVGGFLMQYTGLNDANGTEVYEGDIVESQPVMGRSYRYVVAWDNGKGETLSNQVGWVLKNDWHSMPLEVYCSPYDPDHAEYLAEKVIGNIYQNPELIPEVK